MKLFTSALIFALVTIGCNGDLFKDSIQLAKLRKHLINRPVDSAIRPPGRTELDNPVNITVRMSLVELGFCPKHQELTLGGQIVQTWRDNRFYVPGALFTNESYAAEDYVVLRYRDMFTQNVIWTPDTFIVSSKAGMLHKQGAQTGGRSNIRMTKPGDVTGSFRFRTKVDCPSKMDADEVQCTVAIESFSYQVTDVGYSWAADTPVSVSATAVDLLRNWGWELTSTEVTSEPVEVEGVGSYSSLKLAINLKKIHMKNEI